MQSFNKILVGLIAISLGIWESCQDIQVLAGDSVRKNCRFEVGVLKSFMDNDLILFSLLF